MSVTSHQVAFANLTGNLPLINSGDFATMQVFYSVYLGITFGPICLGHRPINENNLK